MVERAAPKRRTSIVKALACKKVLLTGVTGFLGQAVVERLLLDFPDTRIVVLVRPQLGSTGRQRLESKLTRPTFNVLRDELGHDGVYGLRGSFVHQCDDHGLWRDDLQ